MCKTNYFFFKFNWHICVNLLLKGNIDDEYVKRVFKRTVFFFQQRHYSVVTPFFRSDRSVD